MLTLIDICLTVFHGALVGFNLLGWVWRRTRRAHFTVISLTLFSWVGLGAFYGLGYCPLTDWHWDVKRDLGQGPLPSSYVKYYADTLTGLEWDAFAVDVIVGALGVTAFLLSAWLNWKDLRRRQSRATS